MTSTLVEFRAGRMTVSGTTVKPDKRKGMVMLQQVRVGCWTVYAKVRSRSAALEFAERGRPDSLLLEGPDFRCG
jgi:hypothetical protein